jgi:hypothetical protein
MNTVCVEVFLALHGCGEGIVLILIKSQVRAVCREDYLIVFVIADFIIHHMAVISYVFLVPRSEALLFEQTPSSLQVGITGSGG